MKPTTSGKLLICAALLVSSLDVRGQFVAFWDHAAGTNIAQMHPNTTVGDAPVGSYKLFKVVLRNIATGLPTPVTMEMTNCVLSSGWTVTAAAACDYPAPGTPLYNTFYYPTNVAGQPTNYSYVCFGPSTNFTGVIQLTNASAKFIFRGLNPKARYSFKGGAVRGGDTNSEMRWRYTGVEIAGAESFVPRMTANVVTSAHTTDLATNQVAVNFGCNQTPDTGDMVAWENIDPGPDGTFSIICTRYTGSVPGGSSAGGRAFSINGIRFEEQIPATLSVTNHRNGNITLGWDSPDGKLEESTNLVHWATSPRTNGETIGTTTKGSFFRVRQ